MAALATGQYMGNKNFALTTTNLADIAAKDPGLYNADIAKLARNAFYFTLPLQKQAAVGDATATGIGVVARFPFRVFYAELGCEAAAGASATAKIEKALASDPATFSSLTVSATTDIKTAAPTLQGATIDVDKCDIAEGDVLRMSITGAAGGNVTGGTAILHCVRL